MLSRMEHNSNNVRELSLFPEDDTESEERQEVDKIDLQPLFERLAKSKFRSSFYLNAKDKAYIKAKGWEKIEQGTRETIAKRLLRHLFPTTASRRRCATAFSRRSSPSMPPDAVAAAVWRNGMAYRKAVH